MIKVLGTRRILIIMTLLGLNGLFAAVAYGYLQPQLKKEEKVLRSAKSKESQVRADISNLQLEFDQLEEQQDEFNSLKQDGFFSNQSRRQVEQVFLDAETNSGVLKATVNVKPGVVTENEDANKADHVLLESPISISIQSIDDTDVYVYLDYLQKNFPGYLAVEDVYMRRLGNVSDTILRAIAGGSEPALVEAKVEMLWSTMVERGTVMDAPSEEQGGL